MPRAVTTPRMDLIALEQTMSVPVNKKVHEAVALLPMVTDNESKASRMGGRRVVTLIFRALQRLQPVLDFL